MTQAPPPGLDTLRATRALLASAYADDPLMAWIFPDVRTRADATAAWLGLFAETYLAGGGADLLGTPDLHAVACWRWPDPPPASGASGAPTIGGLLSALVGSGHAERVGAGLAAIRAVTPPEPHAYLHLLAVHPDKQGGGLGRALVTRGLERSAAASLPVHLETTNESAVGFYRRLGFDVTAELDLPGGGPHLWAMASRPVAVRQLLEHGDLQGARGLET
jgi:ribosomal protein S18 acetylase RimI-like enzyme